MNQFSEILIKKSLLKIYISISPLLPMQIEKIRLGQDSRGYGKGLFVENVRVAPVDSEPVTFPCACWLAEDVWDSKTERDLLPGKAVKRPESMF